MSRMFYPPAVLDNQYGLHDVYTLLLKERVIFVTGQVEEKMASNICAQLLFLNSEDSEKPIELHIDSPGGSVIAGLRIIDTMNAIKAPVATIACGMAASMGFMILINGEKGLRFSLPHAQIMMHAVSAGTQGTIHNMEVDLAHSRLLNDLLMKQIAAKTKMSLKTVHEKSKLDYWLQAEDAKRLGVVDDIRIKL